MSAIYMLLFVALVSIGVAIYAIVADITHRLNCEWIIKERDADIEYLQRQITYLQMDIRALTERKESQS